MLLTWGGEIRPLSGGLWDMRDPTLAQTLCSQIENVALPILRIVETIEDFAAFTTSSRFPDTYLDTRPLRHIVVAAGLGRFDEALAIFDNLAMQPNDWTSWPAVHGDYHRLATILCPLIEARDRAGVGKLLREWEAWSVRKMKLDALWEPTPFQVETDG